MALNHAICGKFCREKEHFSSSLALFSRAPCSSQEISGASKFAIIPLPRRRRRLGPRDSRSTFFRFFSICAAEPIGLPARLFESPRPRSLGSASSVAEQSHCSHPPLQLYGHYNYYFKSTESKESCVEYVQLFCSLQKCIFLLLSSSHLLHLTQSFRLFGCAANAQRDTEAFFSAHFSPPIPVRGVHGFGS